MDEVPDFVQEYWFWAICVIIGGIVLGRILSSLVERIVTRKSTEHTGSLWGKIVFYGMVFITFLVAIALFNLDITTVLAAAGVLGIAIGFAAQTSFANIISGIFLLFEQPFKVGDAIIISGETMGMVLSIDLLSVKLRKFDNQFIRVPNEKIIKNEITNITRYDIRRFDLEISIAYDEDITEAMEVLEERVKNHSDVLRKPDPQVLVTGLGDSGVNLMARVWLDRSEFIENRSHVLRDMKIALDEANIEIPYPHRKHFLSDDLRETLEKRGPMESPPPPDHLDNPPENDPESGNSPEA